MARVFLDTNYFIDAVARLPEKPILASLEGHSPYVSPLSWHIYCYVYRIKMPNEIVLMQKGKFHFVDFSEIVLKRALSGPTDDFEDNVQLHSASEVDCDLFLTNDNKLIDLGYFGKTKIILDLES